jgi:AbrB family looped-hinge helix DNA binding protein
MEAPMRPDEQRMSSEIQGLTTVSDRIRALNRAGYSRGDIARFLGKRYKQVRNVLVGDEQVARGREPQAQAAPQRDQTSSPGSSKVRVGPAGQIQLPASMREALGLKEGDVLFARLEEGEIHLLTPKAAMQRAQALVRQFLPEGVSLVDELLQDRRQEVEREKQGG